MHNSKRVSLLELEDSIYPDAVLLPGEVIAKRGERAPLARNRHLEPLHQPEHMGIDKETITDIVKSRTSRATDSGQAVQGERT